MEKEKEGKEEVGGGGGGRGGGCGERVGREGRIQFLGRTRDGNLGMDLQVFKSAVVFRNHTRGFR